MTNLSTEIETEHLKYAQKKINKKKTIRLGEDYCFEIFAEKDLLKN